MVTTNFVAGIIEHRRAAPDELPPLVIVGIGELVQPQRKARILSIESGTQERPDHQLICTDGRHNPEVWGTWSRGRSSIDLLLERGGSQLGSGRVRVYLLLRRPPGLANTTLTTRAACGAVRKINIGARTKYLTSLECTPLPTASAQQGHLSLTLMLDGDGARQDNDGCVLGIGINALIAVDANDIDQRLEALESLVTLD